MNLSSILNQRKYSYVTRLFYKHVVKLRQPLGRILNK